MMPGFLGGNKAAAGGVPPGMNLKDALIQAAPLFASMAAGYSSGRGPYAYMDQGIASIQANQKAKRDEEAAAAAAAAFGNLRPGGMGAAGGGGLPIATAPRNPNDPTSISGDTMAALGKDSGTAGYRASLIGTESGGNWKAQNSEIGAGGKAGHFGRVQFGQARLQEAMNAGAIPQGTTPEQFMNSPALQIAAENWHFADLESQLGDLVGREVNGKVMDLPALVAMGHLGGAGGARKYVESGGAYNPSDSFGTSLADYANTHGGSGGAAPAGPVDPMSDPYVQQLMAVMAMPGMTPEQQAVIQMQLESRIGMLTAPQPGAEEEATRAMRARDADLLGYTRGSPEWNQYVVTGEMPEPPKAGYTRLTPEQVATIPGLDATKAWQVSPEGKIEPIGGAGTSVTVDMGGGPELGKLSTDYGYVLGPDRKPKIDPATGLPMAAPVPGSPAALEAEAAANKSSLAADKTASTADVVLKKLDELDALVAGSGVFNPATGFGAETAANIGGTRAADTKAVIDTISGNLSFDNLAAMRAASPTGGALGAISDREIILLSSTLASLSQKQSPEQLAQNIKQLREIYTTIKAKAEAYPSAGQYGFGGAAPAGNTTSSGVTWSVAP
jgi:hypothetical protein